MMSSRRKESESLVVYCAKCNKETEFDRCPICGSETTEELPRVVYWCDNCNTPVLKPHGTDDAECPLCRSPLRYLCADMRPVFPEERLLFELLIGKPLRHLNDAVWAVGSKYYVNGHPHSIPVKQFAATDPSAIREGLAKYAKDNSYDAFDESIERFKRANSEHLSEIIREACEFIRKAAKEYPEENIVVSFSGGKDSTVTADLAVRALSNPYLVHIFGDTTLEFPSTLEYVKRFREAHPLAIFKVARNSEQDFYEVAAEIGPPARMMRWCCSMFKTGPISRAFNGMYRNQSILTFYGIRKGESVTRSKYNRIEDSAESVKIQQQRVAAPIFYWNDIDVWLYLLSEDVDFNDAYRLGFERVGCWCCPNNNVRAQFLSSVYMPDQSKNWRDFLISFAERIGKPDPEVYVDSGKWKARQGGNGLAAAESVKVDANRCATEDNAMIFNLNKPYSDELVGLFTPLGLVAPDLGRKLLNETVFVDPKTKLPLVAVLPFNREGSEYSVKVRALQHGTESDVLRMAKYQVIKYNACRQCLKCESLCRFGAISIIDGSYSIDRSKCTHCKQCVTDKYLEGGCLMRKYLRTKE
jgi:phosphoadenosine phosphosulfate reductase